MWVLRGSALLLAIVSLLAFLESRVLPPFDSPVRVVAKVVEKTYGNPGGSARRHVFKVYMGSDALSEQTVSEELWQRIQTGDMLEIRATSVTGQWREVTLKRTGETIALPPAVPIHVAIVVALLLAAVMLAASFSVARRRQRH